MAVALFTTNPQGLLGNIKRAIQEGHIETWAHVQHNGTDFFTHITPDKQWYRKAYLRPSIENGRLTLNIIRPEKADIPRAVYAVYHGRFIQTAIDHFPKVVTLATATPNPAAGDDVGTME